MLSKTFLACAMVLILLSSVQGLQMSPKHEADNETTTTSANDDGNTNESFASESSTTVEISES